MKTSATSGRRPLTALVTAIFAVAAVALPAAGTLAANRDSAAGKRAAAERDFLRTVKADHDANLLTADIHAYEGSHVAFVCKIDSIVRDDTIIGQCGKAVEPVDLYVLMPTKGRHLGDEFRLLGIVQPPAEWVDALGHTTLYPIVRAVFTDPTNAPQ